MFRAFVANIIFFKRNKLGRKKKKMKRKKQKKENRRRKGRREEGKKERWREEKNVSALVSKAGGPDTKLPVLGVKGGGVNFLKVLIKS